jgi:hypothetical protein
VLFRSDHVGLLVKADNSNYQVVLGYISDLDGQIIIVEEEVIKGTLSNNSLVDVSVVLTDSSVTKALSIPRVQPDSNPYGNTYTITDELCGNIILLGSATAITLAFATDLPIGHQCSLIRTIKGPTDWTIEAPEGTVVNGVETLNLGSDFQTVFLLKYSETEHLALY